MFSDLFYNRYRVPSARAKWHDYGGGAYFITICTKGKEHYFGRISNGEMQLSAVGEYAKQCIEQISQHNPYAHVPLYVIMPNHIHLIAFIDATAPVETVHAPSENNNEFVETVHAPSENDNEFVETVHAPSKNDNEFVETVHAPSEYLETVHAPSLQTTNNRWKNDMVDEQMQMISEQKNRLSYSIGNFKSAVSRFATQNNIQFAWQTRFYDRIIRNRAEMNRIANYIENNVTQWEVDYYNK